MTYIHFIAKLLKDGQWTSVIAHCFDVAALAEQLTLRQADRVQRRLQEGLGLDHRSMVAWVALIAGLHDLCKLTWAFQLMRGIDEKFAELNGEFDTKLQDRINDFKAKRSGEVSPVQHAILLAVVLPPLLTEVTGIDSDTAFKLTSSAVGHHALFITDDIYRRAERYLRLPQFKENELADLRLNLVKKLWSELSFDGIRIPSKVEFGVVHQISGLIQQSDHMGSRERQMPLQNGGCRPFAETRQKAIEILDFYRYKKPAHVERPSFEQLGLKPRAMQEIIAGLDLTEPFCLFVKAGTGNGKTAAAVQAALNGEGFVFGANNQSTANSIHTSVNDLLKPIEPADGQALALAHSNRHSIIEQVMEELLEDNPSDPDLVRGKFELQAEGLMDALTSKNVVATIDQLLMSIFNDGRAAFRLHWLTSKINILDEVHALDGRLDALLQVYLKILGRFKTPVVLLSATISSNRMNKLLQAWCEGAEVEFKPVTLESDDQVIHINDSSTSVLSIDKGKTPQKIVKLNFFEDCDTQPMDIDGSVIEMTGTERMIWKRSKEVKRLVWMGATAKEVQNSFEKMAPLLKKRGIKAICFHAKFNPLDRVNITKCVFDALGASASANSRVVLFTTNVFRESLNLDCDELITHSCLMPEIIQALGRVHRFARPECQGRDAQIHISRPFIARGRGQTPDRLSFGNFDAITQCLYSRSDFGFRAFYALRTFLKLSELSELRLPFDAQALVDDCFNIDDPSYPSNLPSDWKPYWDSFKDRQIAAEVFEAETIANITIPTDFSIHQTEFTQDFLGQFTADKLERKKHATRLIEGTLSFFVQDAEDDGMVRTNSDLQAVAVRTVSTSNRGYMSNFVLSQLVPDEWKQHRILKNVPRIIVGQPSFVRGDNGKVWTILYRRDIGLRIT